jgi:hypothetical protein
LAYAGPWRRIVTTRQLAPVPTGSAGSGTIVESRRWTSSSLAWALRALVGSSLNTIVETWPRPSSATVIRRFCSSVRHGVR